MNIGEVVPLVQVNRIRGLGLGVEDADGVGLGGLLGEVVEELVEVELVLLLLDGVREVGHVVVVLLPCDAEQRWE